MTSLSYVELSEAICSYPMLSGAIWSYLELSGAIWIYLELPRAIWRFLKLSGNSWNYLALSGAIWSYLELSEAIWSGSDAACSLGQPWKPYLQASSFNQALLLDPGKGVLLPILNKSLVWGLARGSFIFNIFFFC